MREAHVLEIIGKRPVGGVGTVMLNYQRHMNMERVQMDYLIFGEQEETFDKEVKKLGSRVYTYPALSGRQMRQTRKYFEQFFSEHHNRRDDGSQRGKAAHHGKPPGRILKRYRHIHAP